MQTTIRGDVVSVLNSHVRMWHYLVAESDSLRCRMMTKPDLKASSRWTKILIGSQGYSKCQADEAFSCDDHTLIYLVVSCCIYFRLIKVYMAWRIQVSYPKSNQPCRFTCKVKSRTCKWFLLQLPEIVAYLRIGCSPRLHRLIFHLHRLIKFWEKIVQPKARIVHILVWSKQK